MKELYSTEIKKKVKEKVQKQEEREGKQITVTEEVEKEVPVKLIVRDPSRKIREDAEFYFAKTVSSLVNQGINSRHAMRAKLFGGLVQEIEQIEFEYNRIIGIEEKDRSEKDKKELERIQKVYQTKLRELMSLEDNHQALFERTAEAIADNKLAVYWALNLTYIKEENKDPVQYFDGDSLDEKYASYDILEEKNDAFYTKIVERVIPVLALWRNGMAKTQEDFDKFIKKLEEKTVNEDEGITENEEIVTVEEEKVPETEETNEEKTA